MFVDKKNPEQPFLFLMVSYKSNMIVTYDKLLETQYICDLL